MTSIINEEYLSYVDYLKSVNFEKILNNLKAKYADKKVILFGTGVLLDAILDNYNITEYLNIIGISDKRAEESNATTYKELADHIENLAARLEEQASYVREIPEPVDDEEGDDTDYNEIDEEIAERDSEESY